jgi:hypothetical protein
VIAMSLGTVGILDATGMKGGPAAFPFFAGFVFLFARSRNRFQAQQT